MSFSGHRVESICFEPGKRESEVKQIRNATPLQSYTYALGYAPLPWYKFEVELETSAEVIESGSGGTDRLQLEATTFENFFQLTPDGKYFVNAGLFVE